MKSPKYNAEQIVDAAMKATALERSLGVQEKTNEPIPAGYRKREEWQRIWGVSNVCSSNIIKRHLASGRMKMIKLRQVDVNGRYQHPPFYKAIK